MKLIMESWRNYIAETENEDPFDCLYIFEGDSVNRTSFSERLNSLNESEDDFALFLEDWGRSVDHHLRILDEQGPPPIPGAGPPPVPGAEGAGGADPEEEARIMAIVNQGNKALATGNDAAAPAVTGKLDRLWAWAKKNPGTAGAVLVGTLTVAAGLACAASQFAGGPQCIDKVKGMLDSAGTPDAETAKATLDTAVENPAGAVEAVENAGAEVVTKVTTICHGTAEECKEALETAKELASGSSSSLAARAAAMKASAEAAGAAGEAAPEAAPEAARGLAGLASKVKGGKVGQAAKKVFRPNR